MNANLTSSPSPRDSHQTASEIPGAVHSFTKESLRLRWLVLVLSIGAIRLLNVLIHRGSAVSVASLFYLTLLSTALIAWGLYGETLPAHSLAGMILAVWGVYGVVKRE